jgi:hypothetical protein
LSLFKVLYRDHHITLTDGFIKLSGSKDEVIPMDQLSASRIDEITAGTYRQGSPLFFFLGLIFGFVFLPVGVFFFIMGLGSMAAKRYVYSLVITRKGEDLDLYTVGHKGEIRKANKMINSALEENHKRNSEKKQAA